jgi:hypothetical protein
VGRAGRVPLSTPVGRGMKAVGVGAGVVGAVARGQRGALRVGRVPLYPTVARGTRAAGGGAVGDAAGLGGEGARVVLHPSNQQQSLQYEYSCLSVEVQTQCFGQVLGVMCMFLQSPYCRFVVGSRVTLGMWFK